MSRPTARPAPRAVTDVLIVVCGLLSWTVRVEAQEIRRNALDVDSQTSAVTHRVSHQVPLTQPVPLDPEVIREEERQEHAVTAWMEFGFGADWGEVGGATAASASVEASIALGHHLFSLRYTYLEEDPCPGSLLCLGSDVSVPHLSNQELSVQYGWKKRLPALLVHGSVGPAIIWTVQRGTTLESQACFLGCVDTYNAINHLTFGAAGEAGFALTSSVIGIGPAFLFDVNPVQSSWGVVLDLYVGWMGRSRRW